MNEKHLAHHLIHIISKPLRGYLLMSIDLKNLYFSLTIIAKTASKLKRPLTTHLRPKPFILLTFYRCKTAILAGPPRLSPTLAGEVALLSAASAALITHPTH